MYVAGYALSVYGLTSGSLPLIIVNVAGLLSGTCTLALALVPGAPRSAGSRPLLRGEDFKPGRADAPVPSDPS